MASAEEQIFVRKVQFQLNEALECQEENREVPRVKIFNDQKNLNSFNESKKEKLIEEQLNIKELPNSRSLKSKKVTITLNYNFLSIIIYLIPIRARSSST
jgi:sucrose-6-phosphate hydrolase SacC (GH32 family)